MNSRMEWVDYAKAIGIILVVYGHVQRGLYNAGLSLDEDVFILLDSIIYSFHMPLFFFLSGLFFQQSLGNRDARELILTKVDTILYPYILWMLLQGSVEVGLSNYTNGSVSFADVIRLWEPRAQFWFLVALFMNFSLFALLYTKSSSKFTLLYFTFFSLVYVFGADLERYKYLWFIINNAPFFIFGILLRQHDFFKCAKRSVALPVVFLVFVIAQYLYHAKFDMIYKDRGLPSLSLALISIVFVVFLSRALANLRVPLLAYIGANSMCIYLMHILAGSGTRVILSKCLGVDSTMFQLLIGTLCGLFLPLVALTIINRYKIPCLFSAPVSKLLISKN